LKDPLARLRTPFLYDILEKSEDVPNIKFQPEGSDEIGLSEPIDSAKFDSRAEKTDSSIIRPLSEKYNLDLTNNTLR
jgi:hypothetical protein